MCQAIHIMIIDTITYNKETRHKNESSCNIASISNEFETTVNDLDNDNDTTRSSTIVYIAIEPQNDTISQIEFTIANINATNKGNQNSRIKSTVCSSMLIIDRYFSTKNAKRDLHYKPLISFEEGWPKTIEWFKINWLPEYQKMGAKDL